MAQNLSNDHINLTMLTDFYEITMANGYFTNGFKDTIGYFDMFFRKVPDGGGFAIMAGVEQLVNYLSELSFTQEDIDYLRSKHIFREEFLDYLKNFKFTCDVWAVPEGTPIFPGEPIVTVRGPVIQAQFVETMVLLSINHQSLIATKTNRIVRAADGRAVMEFGSRRAQGYDGAIPGARAAYIGGCQGTACVLSDRDYKIPAGGTMAHSWVQMFPTEYDAFKAYARNYPDACTLLVDTYNVLKSGVPNAIKVFNEELVPNGHRPAGIRIDSGDITYLSRKARKMLDAAGYVDADGDGWRELPDGGKMDLSVIPQYSRSMEVRSRLGEIVCKSLQNVGVNCHIDEEAIANSEIWEDKVTKEEYDISITFTTSGMLYSTPFRYMLAELRDGDSGWHWGSCHDPRLKEYYYAMTEAINDEQYIENSRTLQHLADEEMFGLTFAWQTGFFPYRTDKIEGWDNWQSWGVINARTWFDLTAK